MTPDEIKKLEEINLGENELVLGEIQSIITAANKDAFWMICYAYTLGFTRGSQQAKEDTDKKQIKGSNLWGIANNADEIGIELERVQYMLQILNENLEDEVNFLKEANNGYAQHFVSRYDMHRAQFEIAELWLHKTREEFAKIPDDLRNHCKAAEVPA